MEQDLREQFHQKMIDIYERSASEIDYRPTRFLQMVRERKGVAAAKALLLTDDPSEGLFILWRLKRLDLSVEALVSADPWRSLFTEEEVATAIRRLADLNYEPGEQPR